MVKIISLEQNQSLKIRFLEDLFMQLKNIKKGEKFTQDNIKVIRPGYGLEPIYYEKLINKKSPISILKETSLKKNILSKLKIK